MKLFINMHQINYFISFLLLFLFGLTVRPVLAQERPSASVRLPATNALWLGTYSKLRIADKFLWDAQFHYRTVNTENTPLVGRLAQIYNRHAISYMATRNFTMSLGGVLRLNFSPDPDNDAFRYLVLEPRIWHEYLFAVPFSRFMVYHRLRIEHRWSRPNTVGADWVYRDRWRYKFYMTIPLNNDRLIPGTFYFTPDVEIIMQSGKTITFNPMEDLRIYPQFGYIYSSRVKYGAGLMYSTGQTADGYIYNSRWVVRINAYLSFDIRKFVDKIPEIKSND